MSSGVVARPWFCAPSWMTGEMKDRLYGVSDGYNLIMCWLNQSSPMCLLILCGVSVLSPSSWTLRASRVSCDDLMWGHLAAPASAGIHREQAIVPPGTDHLSCPPNFTHVCINLRVRKVEFNL